MKARVWVTLAVISGLCGCSDEGATPEISGRMQRVTPVCPRVLAGASALQALLVPRESAYRRPAGRPAATEFRPAERAEATRQAQRRGRRRQHRRGAGSGRWWNGGAQGTAGSDALPPLPLDKALPIVFVHGYAGSAQQWQSQAMRFVANGYPPDRIIAYEHDGAGLDTAALRDRPHDRSWTECSRSSAPARCSSSATRAERSCRAATWAIRSGRQRSRSTSRSTAAPARPPCRASRRIRRCSRDSATSRSARRKESFAVQYEFLLGSRLRSSTSCGSAHRSRSPVAW